MELMGFFYLISALKLLTKTKEHFLGPGKQLQKQIASPQKNKTDPGQRSIYIYFLRLFFFPV
jgi:hypothetical protein